MVNFILLWEKFLHLLFSYQVSSFIRRHQDLHEMNSFLRSCCCCCIGRKYYDCQDNKKDDLPKSLLKTNKFYDETLGIEKIAVFADDIDRKNLKIGSEKKQVAVKVTTVSAQYTVYSFKAHLITKIIRLLSN